MERLDVDALVHVAVRGPIGAVDWRPAVRDADAFGQQLWALNFEAAAYEGEDEPPPLYEFTPIPVGVTAVEGLKQIAFYEYQTKDEDGRWEASPVPEVLRVVQDGLIGHFPGFDDAPWGWGQPELVARAGREPHEPQPEPLALTALRRQWRDASMPLAHVTVMRPEFQTYDSRIVGSAAWWPSGASGFAPIGVSLCVGPSEAASLFRSHASERITHRLGNDRHVYRFGDVVVVLSAPTIDGSTEELDRRLRLLGKPDEHWWGGDPPIASPKLEVVAAGVALDPARAGRHHYRDAFVARTPAELARLAALVGDPAVKAAVKAIDTRKQSVILVRGLSELDGVESAQVHPDPQGGLRLVVHAAHASSMSGTVLIIDRPSSKLGILQVMAPEFTLELAAQEA